MTVEASEIRARSRQEWSVAAAGWRRRRGELSGATRAVTERMVELADPRPGERVVDLACGTGDPALTFAERVGPSGRVVGLDLSADMVEAAREAAKGLDHVEFAVIEDETTLGVAPSSFDVASSRFGIMLMPDPAGALRALGQAVRPGGRAIVATWASAPTFLAILDVFARHGDMPPPDPGAPGPLAVSSPERMGSLLADAGLESVRTEVVATTMFEGEGPEEAWRFMVEVAGPVGGFLRSLDAERQAQVERAAIDALGTLGGSSPTRLEGEALLGLAARPG